MSFEYNVVTSAGAAIIAAATASNPMVIVKCLSSESAAESLVDLASKTQSFYDGKEGTIFAASATDNVARIIMNFDNSALQSAQYIKSACILAKLQSQSDSDAVILAAISDDDSGIVLPDGSSPITHVHIPINITINADNQVATVGAQYADLSDLARFVSVHKAGNPTEGDDQTVYGSKLFVDHVILNHGQVFYTKPADDSAYNSFGVDGLGIHGYEKVYYLGECLDGGEEDDFSSWQCGLKLDGRGWTINNGTRPNHHVELFSKDNNGVDNTFLKLSQFDDGQSLLAHVSPATNIQSEIKLYGDTTGDPYTSYALIETKTGTGYNLYKSSIKLTAGTIDFDISNGSEDPAKLSFLFDSTTENSALIPGTDGKIWLGLENKSFEGAFLNNINCEGDFNAYIAGTLTILQSTKIDVYSVNGCEIHTQLKAAEIINTPLPHPSAALENDTDSVTVSLGQILRVSLDSAAASMKFGTIVDTSLNTVKIYDGTTGSNPLAAGQKLQLLEDTISGSHFRGILCMRVQ